jgi:hypothetical protein
MPQEVTEQSIVLTPETNCLSIDRFMLGFIGCAPGVEIVDAQIVLFCPTQSVGRWPETVGVTH